MNDTTSLPPVHYTVRLETVEWEEHPATVFEEDQLEVRAFELDEALHEPFELELTLVTADHDIDVDTLVGGRLSMSWQREEEERFVHGIVHRAWYLGTFREKAHLRLSVGPALGLLGVGRRSRVFQDLSVVQIVEGLVEQELSAHGRTIDTSRLGRTYDPLDYCVQFRESDLAFITRILAREGIGFFFEHDDEVETIVLFDDPRIFQGAVPMPDGGDRTPPILPVLTSVGGRPGIEAIESFEWRRHTRPGRFEAAAADWKAFEHSRMSGEVTTDPPPPWERGEQYDHQWRRLVEDGGTGPHLDHYPQTTSDRFERAEARSQSAVGSSTAFALSPGQTFEIEGHPQHAMDRGYTVVKIVHRADCPQVDIDNAGAFAGPNYENRFECIPQPVPWRPRTPARPNVGGHLLATVVGPSGEEIHTDEHGRIKVWMHWDREHGPDNADSSCWLRVAQTWAGPGWGSMFIPRVGMEVLVSFAEGDPDRPLCVGCVYNGRNTPPYPLPDERTKSTIKTHSSPGGNGFNELRFEDAAGAEEVFLHAQRDFNEVVGNAHTRSVGHTESITVGDDRTLAVKGSQTVTIDGNHSVTVKGTSKQGAPEPPPNYSIEVDKDFSLKATDNIFIEAGKTITLKVGNTMVTMTPQGITQVAGDGAVETLHDAAVVKSSGAASVILGSDGSVGVVAMPGGAAGASLSLDTAAAVSSKAGAAVALDGDAKLHASASSPATPGASLELNDSAFINGMNVELTSQTASLILDMSATLESPKITITGTDITCEGVKTTISAAQLTAQGAAMVTITAPMVKIN